MHLSNILLASVMDATEIPPLLAFSFLSKMFYKVNIVEGKTIK